MISQNITRVLARITNINKKFEKLFKVFTRTENNQPATNTTAANTNNFQNRMENAIRNSSSASQTGVNTQGAANVYETTAANLANTSYKYKDIIVDAAAKYGLNPNLIRAIIKTESDFNPRAVSNKGAKGLMQIMPFHFSNLGITNPFDPRQNILSGTKLFRNFYNKFNKNIYKALAAYNAGANAVKSGRTENSQSVQNYVKKVLSHFNNYGG